MLIQIEIEENNCQIFFQKKKQFILQDESTGDGDGGQYHAVELTRGTRGFGFSIRGGREFQNMPLFVLQIAENGPASVDNRLRVSRNS